MKCPQCEKNKWKTLIKGAKWQCRKCGFVKEDPEKMYQIMNKKRQETYNKLEED